MSMQLNFDYTIARRAGVVFTPIIEEVLIYANYEEGIEEFKPKIVGHKISLPNDVVIYSRFSDHFECKNINHEARDWFLDNVKDARLSY